MSSTTSAPQPRIELPVNPADVGLGMALRAAGRYWAATPAHWVVPVVAVALVNLLAVLVLGSAAITSQQLQVIITTGSQGPELDTATLPRVIAGPAAVGIVTVVARWFLVANAIAGLRGRELAMGWILGAGVRSFAADMILSLSVVSVFTLALVLGPFALVALPVAAVLAVYAAIRLTFWTLAIFDGQALFAGAEISWRITRRSVLRVFGWGLAIAGIGFLAGIPLLVLGLLIPSLPVVIAVAGGTVEMLLTAWTTVVMAILYESQRLRSDPVAYQASLAQSTVRAPAEPPGPYDPPPPPA